MAEQAGSPKGWRFQAATRGYRDAEGYHPSLPPAVLDADGALVVEARDDGEARLIAAAPEMAQMLARLIGEALCGDVMDRTVREAQALLGRAEGEKRRPRR